MPSVTYQGRSYDCSGQSILDCLTAHGVHVPSSCRSGVCQSCMMRASKGTVPEKSQAGLRPTLAAQNYFLACSCVPEGDMEVTLPDSGFGTLSATVTKTTRLNDDTLGLWLRPSRQYEYRAGQFIRLHKDEDNSRCYSLASVPELDGELFLNIRRTPGGLVSNWVHESLGAGDQVEISEAMGQCFYLPGNPEKNMLLVGTGSGLSPLYGIARDALLRGHLGEIHLYHGSRHRGGLYLEAELAQLMGRHKNFNYVPCTSGDEPAAGYLPGRALDMALARHQDLGGWRVYLCGNPDMVNSAKRKTFFAGASLKDIHADPFGF